jgi:hypothetical protein
MPSTLVLESAISRSRTVASLVAPSAPLSNPWQATFANAGWFCGILDTSSTPSAGVLLSHLTVEKCGHGIFLYGKGACIEHIAANNNGIYGIFASYGSVTNCKGTSNAWWGLQTS